MVCCQLEKKYQWYQQLISCFWVRNGYGSRILWTFQSFFFLFFWTKINSPTNIIVCGPPRISRQKLSPFQKIKLPISKDGTKIRKMQDYLNLFGFFVNRFIIFEFFASNLLKFAPISSIFKWKVSNFEGKPNGRPKRTARIIQFQIEY